MKRESEFRIGDFFNKYGFGDGDDVRLLDRALEVRPRVARALNRAFVKRGLPYRAVRIDYGTVHNPVRLCLQWKEGETLCEWDCQGLLKGAFGERTWESGAPAGVEEVLDKVAKRWKSRR